MNGNSIMRFLVFLCLLVSCLWAANIAFVTNSGGFGFLSFFLFLASAQAASGVFDATRN